MSDAEPPPDIEDLIDDLEALEETAGDPETREQIQETIETAMAVQTGVFGRVIRGFDRADAMEALLGALLFGIPMFVEGGTQEVGAFLAERPLLLATNVAGAVAVVVGILYVADIQHVRVHRPLFGFLPRRLVGVVGISFLAALVAMTGWGRVDWTAPTEALAQVVVAFVPMSIGAALGDILPGS